MVRYMHQIPFIIDHHPPEHVAKLLPQHYNVLSGTKMVPDNYQNPQPLTLTIDNQPSTIDHQPSTIDHRLLGIDESMALMRDLGSDESMALMRDLGPVEGSVVESVERGESSSVRSLPLNHGSSFCHAPRKETGTW